MIEIRDESLVFSFSDVHPQAVLYVDLLRTLRLEAESFAMQVDGSTTDPANEFSDSSPFGRFPLRHVEDYESSVPKEWSLYGGILFPMYQSEALELHFSSSYPIAIKIAAGKINVVTGAPWEYQLRGDPQDHIVSTLQSRLRGFLVETDKVRQFVAMPLGEGLTAEEQITGNALHGGLQIVAYPLKQDVAERYGLTDLVEGTGREVAHAAFKAEYPSRSPVRQGAVVPSERLASELELEPELESESEPDSEPAPFFEESGTLGYKPDVQEPMSVGISHSQAPMSMGISPGELMTQANYRSPFDVNDWDVEHASRCFIHIADSRAWKSITGETPSTTPPNARDYAEAGIA